MCSLLLKKALPFTLTLVLGSFIGGLFKSVSFGGQKTERARAYFYGYGEGRSGCKHAHGRYLVAETKPLIIFFKPDARLPQITGEDIPRSAPRSALVRVTFGADGKVQAVEPFYENAWGINRLPFGPYWKEYWESVERAARQIQFAPEVENGLPVTVTKELEIFFLPE
jgi:hypothetical protein